MPVVHKLFAGHRCDQSPCSTVPFPGIAEHALAIMTPKQDRTLPQAVVSDCGVIARSRSGNIQKKPTLGPELPGITCSIFSRPASKAQDIFARGVVGHHRIETTWYIPRLQLGPCTTIPFPSFIRRPGPTKKYDAMSILVISH